MKRTIRLTESELRNMISESVENILMEDEIEEVTVDPRWWRKDGELPDMKGDTYRKPKQIKVSEAQLRQIIRESIHGVLDEVAGYKDTMQKAGNNFNQNTFMGKVRSKLQPKKYQQYQRIQQQGNQIGQQAADNVNAETEKVPIGCGGKHGTTYNPMWNTYAQEQGSNNLSGEQLYNQRTASDQAKINKYGTGGRVMLPLQGYNNSYEGPERQYREQQRLLNRPYKWNDVWKH